MKKTQFVYPLSTCLLLLISSIAFQAQNLFVWKSDNSKEIIELSEWPTIKRLDAKLLIISSKIELEYDINDISRFTYEIIETGIRASMKPSNHRIETDRIVFERSISADHIALFTVGGIHLPVVFEQQGETIVLSLAGIPSGMYILDLGVSTIKIIKK